MPNPRRRARREDVERHTNILCRVTYIIKYKGGVKRGENTIRGVILGFARQVHLMRACEYVMVRGSDDEVRLINMSNVYEIEPANIQAKIDMIVGSMNLQNHSGE